METVSNLAKPKTSYPKEKIKVLLLESIHTDAKATFAKYGYENVTILSHALQEEELIEALKDVHMVGIRSKTQMTRKVIEALVEMDSPLRAIGCFCIGTNQVDLVAAEENGIAVFNSPHSNTRSVAELVIAECVMLMRKIPARNAAAHEGRWLKDADQSNELRGKTLGIIGYGNIGSQVSILAEALGMKVLYYDVAPKLPLGNATSLDSMDEILENSDIISLHVPAEEGTKNLFSAEVIAKIRKGTILLNLSRGNVVDIEALKAALESGQLRGAAIDVFPWEPKSKNEPFTTPLQGVENVILTPHIGGSTQEAQENIGKDVAIKLSNYMDTGRTVGCITVPELNLPQHSDKSTHRVLHIHKNVPGVLNAINTALADINILGQFLKTTTNIGYVVIDVEAKASKEALRDLRKVPNTIEVRVLY